MPTRASRICSRAASTLRCRSALMPLENFLIRRIDLLITVGEKLRQHFAERGARRSVVVGNWKRLEEFSRTEAAKLGGAAPPRGSRWRAARGLHHAVAQGPADRRIAGSGGRLPECLCADRAARACWSDMVAAGRQGESAYSLCGFRFRANRLRTIPAPAMSSITASIRKIPTRGLVRPTSCMKRWLPAGH